MVWRRSTTLGTVVEDHHLRVFVEQFVYLAIVVTNALRLVPDAGNGEVDRQDGVGVHEQVEMAVDRFLRLFLRTVRLAEETRSLSEHLLVDAGTCGDDACRVPLYLYGRGSYGQLACLYVTQVLIAPTGIVPLLQLAVEEALQRGVVHQFLLALEHLLTGQDLECAQAILIEVVGVDAVDAECGIAVASPPPTEIEFCEDTSDAVVAREDES